MFSVPGLLAVYRLSSIMTPQLDSIWACHVPRQSVHSYPSGHLAGWATPWSAEEMLGGQRQRMDISARARTAQYGLPQKITGRGPVLNPPPPPPPHPPHEPIGQGTDLN